MLSQVRRGFSCPHCGFECSRFFVKCWNKECKKRRARRKPKNPKVGHAVRLRVREFVQYVKGPRIAIEAIDAGKVFIRVVEPDEPHWSSDTSIPIGDTVYHAGFAYRIEDVTRGLVTVSVNVIASTLMHGRKDVEDVPGGASGERREGTAA